MARRLGLAFLLVAIALGLGLPLREAVEPSASGPRVAEPGRGAAGEPLPAARPSSCPSWAACSTWRWAGRSA